VLNLRAREKKQPWKIGKLASILRRSSSLRCHSLPMEIDKRRSLLLAFVVVLVICAWAGLIFLAITVTQTVIAILEFAVESLTIS
jgi:hypothetical protein